MSRPQSAGTLTREEALDRLLQIAAEVVLAEDANEPEAGIEP